MNKEDRIYEDVHNYTKFKLVEMLIDRVNNDKTIFDNDRVKVLFNKKYFFSAK